MLTPRRLSSSEIEAAALLLVASRRTGRRLDGLPAPVRPECVEDGLAVQDKVHEILGDEVGAIKVNAHVSGNIFRGIVSKSRIFESPAVLSASEAGLMGIEAEIAFVFPDGVPARATPYSYDEVAEMAEAMPVFDIVDTRLNDFLSRTQFERVADSLNAGALVLSPPIPNWRKIDFRLVEVVLWFDNEVVVRQTGDHPWGDPLLPALQFINSGLDKGLPPQTVLTTGSFTGFKIAKPRQKIRAEFADLGSVEVYFST